MFAAAAVVAAANGNGVAAGVAAACGVDAGDAVVPEL
jgi:threonine/homoserine/homoserine lactone efflux protein